MHRTEPKEDFAVKQKIMDLSKFLALLGLEARPSAPELSILFLQIVRLNSGVLLHNRSVRSNPVNDVGCVQEVADLY